MRACIVSGAAYDGALLVVLPRSLEAVIWAVNDIRNQALRSQALVLTLCHSIVTY